MTIGCSSKCLVKNNYCENLPTVSGKDFKLVWKNSKFAQVKSILVQTKSIKECGCIDPSLQLQCFERFK